VVFLCGTLSDPSVSQFSVHAAQPGDAFVPLHGQDLERIFSAQHERVAEDNTVRVRLGGQTWEFECTPWRATLFACRVTLYEHLDETEGILYGPHVVGQYAVDG
jgi:hypothetical protein